MIHDGIYRCLVIVEKIRKDLILRDGYQNLGVVGPLREEYGNGKSRFMWHVGDSYVVMLQDDQIQVGRWPTESHYSFGQIIDETHLWAPREPISEAERLFPV